VKIIFLTACLEAGRDGVGDYTLRLARECLALGHTCTVIALHDTFVSHSKEENREGLRLIRLSALHPWRTRSARVESLVRDENPQWLSWQMVAYGYHSKGILPSALARLAAEISGTRSHVMLHELWIGLERSAPWRQRAVGWWQRRVLLRWLASVRPACLHTSNATYRRVLAAAGFSADVLPLFGNVAPVPLGACPRSRLALWLPNAGGSSRDSFLIAVTFGTLHPQWETAATARWLSAAAAAVGRKPALLAIGRLGQEPSVALARFKAAGMEVGATGEQDAATVSRLLGVADLGIAPHPWALIGKSGAAAAMLEHGLPVLVPRDEWRLRGEIPPGDETADPLLRRLDGLDAAQSGAWLALRRSARAALPATAGTFIAALASV